MPRTKTPTDSDLPITQGPLISLKSTLDRPGVAAKQVKTLDEKFEEEPHSGASLSPKMRILIAELSFKKVFSSSKQPVIDRKPLDKGKLPTVTDMNHIRIDDVPQHVLDHYSHIDGPGDEIEEENGEPEVDNETGDFANGRMGVRELLRADKSLSEKEMALQLSHNPNADMFVCNMNGATLVCCADNPICTTCRCQKRFLAQPKVATA